MRVAVAIARKDLRRMRWEIGVSLGVLVVVTWQDVHRYSMVANPIEYLLGFLLGAAWAFVMGRAVLQERLVGDRQLWLTQPIGRGDLLLAKVLFAVAVIHLPGLLADAAVLMAHHFNPLAYLPQLLWKQAVVAALVTLPASAVAAMTRSTAQFAAISFVVVVLVVLRVSPGPEWYRMPEEWLRMDLTVAMLAAAALAVVTLQYWKRRVRLALSVWVVGLLASSWLYGGLPRDFELITRHWNDSRIVLVPDMAVKALGASYLPGWRTMAIPLKAEGDVVSLAESSWRFRQPLQITTTSGSLTIPPYTPQTVPWAEAHGIYYRIDARTLADGAWLLIFSSDRQMNGLPGQTIRIEGTVDADLMQMQELGQLDGMEFQPSRDAGRCAVAPPDAVRSPLAKMRFICESPAPFPPRLHVRIQSPVRPSPWVQVMPQYSWVFNRTPSWLSPLHRTEGYLNVTNVPKFDGLPEGPIPEAALPGAQMTVVQWRRVDEVRLKLDLANLKVDDYLVHEVRYPRPRL